MTARSSDFLLPPSGDSSSGIPNREHDVPGSGRDVPFIYGVNIMKSFALIISLSAFVLASLVLASGWISNIVTSHAALSGVMVGFMVAQLFRERS